MGEVIDMRNPNFENLAKKHPCFGIDAHFLYGRLHLPVSPKCNIQCKFCKRGFNKTENRPGVTRSLVRPEDTVKLIKKALKACPYLTVIGIAGPGDTLATSDALDTFDIVKKEFPDLLKCMSTNGLLVEKYIDRIVNASVDTVTVTVNSVDPDIQKNIISYIRMGDSVLYGRAAAEVLISSQLKGIRLLSQSGIIVKINTVLIPGLNDINIKDIAKTTSKLGASIMNIIPLIPQNEMKSYKTPDCEQLSGARLDAEKYMEVFRHCKHCRADAFGIPGSGKSLSDILYDGYEENFSHG